LFSNPDLADGQRRFQKKKELFEKKKGKKHTQTKAKK